MPRKNHLIVDSGCTQDNERWSLSACGLNEESEVEWDGMTMFPPVSAPLFTRSAL